MQANSIASFILISAISISSFAAKEVVDKIIATVNSEIVLQSDLKKLSQRIDQPGALDEALLFDETAKSIKSDKKAQLQFLIREKMIASEVKRQNLTVTDDRVESEINQLARRNQMTRAEYDKLVIKQGFTLTDFKELQKSKIERQSFFENEIISKLRITDEDAYGEYQTKNPNYKPNVNEYTVAQIFFDPRKKGEGEAAYERASSVLERLKSGESYESLANSLNEDGSGNKDGILGTFKTGELNSDTENAISNLSANSYTGIVKTKQGFHIFKLISKKTTLDPQFLKYKEMIKSSLIEKNFLRQLKNWFESKKQDAYIKIYE